MKSPRLVDLYNRSSAKRCNQSILPQVINLWFVWYTDMWVEGQTDQFTLINGFLNSLKPDFVPLIVFRCYILTFLRSIALSIETFIVNKIFQMAELNIFKMIFMVFYFIAFTERLFNSCLFFDKINFITNKKLNITL